MPTAAGKQAMMKFTAVSVTLGGTVTVTAAQRGTTLSAVTAGQDFTGGVTLYMTRFTGSLRPGPGLPGVTLTLTPATINAASLLALRLAGHAGRTLPLTLAGVRADQLVLICGSQVATRVSMTETRPG